MNFSTNSETIFFAFKSNCIEENWLYNLLTDTMEVVMRRKNKSEKQQCSAISCFNKRVL